MSSRCKCCDVLLYSIHRKKNSSELEDLCSTCRSAAWYQYNYLNDHRYVHQEAEDGDVSYPHDCSNY